MKTVNLSIKIFFLGVLFITIIFSNVFAEEAQRPEEQVAPENQKPIEEQKPLYSAGPWMGKVIDVKTKQPIEGAVVSAVWYREYDTRFNKSTDVHEAKEVLTDSKGYFEISAYTETGEQKDSWPKPKLSMPEGVIEFYIGGPVIKDPEFTIYKPDYNSYPKRAGIIIFAVPPSTIEYQEFYIGKVNDKEVGLFQKASKNFPEGLVYGGMACHPLMEKWGKKVNFGFDSFFFPMEGAVEKIKKFDVPLDCPKKAEPVPVPSPGYKNDLENPLKKGGFIVIGFSKAKSTDERKKAIPDVLNAVMPDKLPLLQNIASEEKEKLAVQEEQEKKKQQEEKK